MVDIASRIIDIPDYPEPGVVFKDITPLFADPEALRATVDALVDHFRALGVTKVIGPEARGFMVGVPVALELGAGFVPARKPGKLPRKTISMSYELEYGTDTLEIHADALTPDDRVVIIDDLIATGGTLAAVGKLVELWGFGTEKPDHEPSAGKISQVLSYSNFGSLTFSKDFGTLRKKDSRTFLNLSAVAKGFGVDEVARLLEQNGIRDYLIEIGGEVRVSGRGPHGSWLVGITIPDPNRNFPEMRIEMTDYSVATSGNYRNYYYRNGRKYAHTISPQTGYPAENALVSATVFYPECAWADAYATALTAMGTEKAKAFAQKQQLAVILQMDGGEVYVSPAARDLIGVSGNAD